MKSIIALLLLTITFNLSAQNAYIQIQSESGISVFLDGAFKGKTSSDVGGLIIENVAPGSHIIKVVKDGFNPQEERIIIKSGEVYTYKVRPFVPRLKITETGNTGEQEIDLQVGKMKIQSLPISIRISIPSLGVNYNKSKDEWSVEEVPVGSYAATFAGMNKTISYTIEIKNNQLNHLFVNMVSGKIEDRSPQYDNYLGVEDNEEEINEEEINEEEINEEEIHEEESYYIVEDMPTFNGRDPAIEFRKYIAQNLVYPENGISGRVIVQFAVNAKGRVVDAFVVRSVDPVLDKEAIRVVMESPTWSPGKQRGKPVKVLFTFPINFNRN